MCVYINVCVGVASNMQHGSCSLRKKSEAAVGRASDNPEYTWDFLKAEIPACFAIVPVFLVQRSTQLEQQHRIRTYQQHVPAAPA